MYNTWIQMHWFNKTCIGLRKPTLYCFLIHFTHAYKSNWLTSSGIFQQTFHRSAFKRTPFSKNRTKKRNLTNNIQEETIQKKGILPSGVQMLLLFVFSYCIQADSLYFLTLFILSNLLTYSMQGPGHTFICCLQ